MRSSQKRTRGRVGETRRFKWPTGLKKKKKDKGEEMKETGRMCPGWGRANKLDKEDCRRKGDKGERGCLQTSDPPLLGKQA